MENIDYILVGGGLASANCAKALRDQGASGSIAIFCAEPFPPYNRPPLSKGLLLGYEKEEGIWVHSQRFFEKNDIQLKLNTPVKLLLADDNVVIDGSDRQYRFKKLLVGTGTKLRKIPLEGGNLDNVFYLRTLEDSRRIKEAMSGAENAVIIGAGFIGMELASAFAQNNIKTTMLVREDKLFEKMASGDLSAFFLKYYRDKGVNILPNSQAAKLEGDGKVEKVVTEADEVIDADVVAIGVGVIPEVGFLEGSGVELNNGVVVNEYLESVSRADVFAAGDVANYNDVIFSKRRRVEHWDHAIKQGSHVAKNMLGKDEPYDQLAYFFSDMFDLSWEFIGDNSEIDEVITRGSWAVDDEPTMAFFLKENVLKAAFLLMAELEDRQVCENLIVSKKDLSEKKDKLADQAVFLNSIL